MIRQIKLRSVENAIYKPTYNRVSWQIAADDMSTDFSQSYLLARLYVTEGAGGADVTPATFANWVAKNLQVSFGTDGDSYSSAALIKTARLIAKGNGSILEEIQFANVLSQCLHQYTMDKECLSSSSLMNAENLMVGAGDSLANTISSLIKNPMDIQIPLSSFLGLGQSTNFHMSDTQGLILELELEDTKSILQLTNSSQVVPTNVAAGGGLGDFKYVGYGQLASDAYAEASTFIPQVETNGFNPITSSSFSEGAGDTANLAKSKTNIRYDGSWFVQPFAANGATLFQNLSIAKRTGAVGVVSAGVLSELGFIVGDSLKMSFSIPDPSFTAGNPNAAQYKILEYVATITAVAAELGATLALISTDANLAYNTALPTDMPQLLSVELLPAASNVVVVSTALENGGYLASNRVYLPVAQAGVLQTMGVFTCDGDCSAGAPRAGDFGVGTSDFDLSIQFDATAGGHGTPLTTCPAVLQPSVSNQGSTFQSIITQGLIRVPTQGKSCRFVGATPMDANGAVIVGGAAASNYLLEFTDLGQQNVNLSLGFLNAAGTYVPHVGSHVVFSGSAGSLGTAALPSLSWRIDRFELVLVQQTKNPKFPPAKSYSTYKLEPVTIESPQQQWQRQFIVSEPSCYNIALLTPDYNGGSLISRGRYISNYRWQINNVDACNRNIYLQDITTDYPSSLHRDKLMDFFQNTTYKLKNLEGITPLSSSTNPVEIIPLKIYSGVVGDQLVMNPNGFTAQIQLYADPTLGVVRYITSGPVFLYKFVIRSL